ncbi:MAG: hypothetical protein KF693_02245 [Nitrospira sp.]|nr:hypothetical protein [Nitrospira sp.]
MASLALVSPAMADWSFTAAGNLYYTDDVALFSATRRLMLNGDPTQPALDTILTGKGSDMVFEPDLTATKTFISQWGRTEVSVRGQGFIYAVNPRFNQANIGVQLLQDVAKDTKIRLRYYTTPDVLLGDNESRQTGSIQEERVTSHIGSLRLERRLSDEWEVRLLGRFGSRTYNDAFAQRDTTFWTVGPHIVWHFTERFALVVGYHYERGLADGRKQRQLEDDTSYVNHYVTAGLEGELTERLSMEAGFHYERNNWTSGISGDERNGGHETVFQGEITLRYRLTERLGALAGFQRSQRRQSFESEVVHNTNVFTGMFYQF